MLMERLVTPTGLEPVTCPLGGGCSIQLSHGAMPARPKCGELAEGATDSRCDGQISVGDQKGLRCGEDDIWPTILPTGPSRLLRACGRAG